MWFTEPDCAYTFPNEDGLCVVLAAPHRDRLPEWRADLEGAYLRYMAGLPDAPDLSHATRESRLIGKLDVPNVSRPAARPGLAFVGDAALAADPLWGVGCGWAFQSADWLVAETADALVGDGDLDAALSPTGASTAAAWACTTSSSPTSPAGGRRTRSSGRCTAPRSPTITSGTPSRRSARGAARRPRCSRRGRCCAWRERDDRPLALAWSA